MNGHRSQFRLIAVSTILVLGQTAYAQSPELTSVFPFACQIGESIEVTASGTNLDGDPKLFFVENRIRAEHIEKNRFWIIVDPASQTRDHDIWLATKNGISNPRRFVITQSPVLVETSGNDKLATAQRIPVPSFVCARFTKAAEIDWFQFEAKREELIVIECRSRTMDGLAEPVVTVIDPDGLEVAHSTGNRREPIVAFSARQTGNYKLRVHERAYRQSNLSFYSVSVSNRPRLLAAHPSLLQPKQKQSVTLYGFGLPDGNPVTDGLPHGIVSIQKEITPPDRGDPDGGRWTNSAGAVRSRFRFSIANVEGFVDFGLTRKAATIENEPANNRMKSAQPISIPSVISGRIDRKGDIDWYAFSAKKGETLSIQALGERLGRMMDLDIAIHDANGKLITTLKDFSAPKGFPATFRLGSLDCSESWKVPADGDYRMIVRDFYGGSVAGVHRTYELSIRRPRPGVRLIARPLNSGGVAGISIPSNGRTVFEVLAVREDGYSDGILIVPGELPKGLSISNSWIGPNEHTTLVSIEVAADANLQPGSIYQIPLSTATDAQLTTSPIRAASTIQKGSPTVRLTESLVASIGQPSPINVSLEPEAHVVPVGSMLRFRIKTLIGESKFDGPVQLELKSLPAGTKAVKHEFAADQDSDTIALNVPSKLAIGNYSIVGAISAKSITAPSNETTDKKAKQKSAAFNTWSNSVSIQVVAAPISVTTKPKQLTLKPGGSGELEVTSKRLDKSVGNVTLVVTDGHSTSRIESQNTTLTGDQSVAKLMIKALVSAPPGKLATAAVEASAQFENRTVVFRLPIDIAITK